MPRARHGPDRPGRHRDPAGADPRPARAVARRVGGLHGRRRPRPRGQPLSRVGAVAARLSAARRRAAAGRVRPGAEGDRPDRREPPERRRRPRGRPRRGDQRLPLPSARRVVQLPLADAHRQLLPDDRPAPAPGLRQRHGAPPQHAQHRLVRRLRVGKRVNGGTGRRRGREGSKGPVPSKRRRAESARMEPSHRGAAHACRVVVSTPPAPAAVLRRAARGAERAP